MPRLDFEIFVLLAYRNVCTGAKIPLPAHRHYFDHHRFPSLLKTPQADDGIGVASWKSVFSAEKPVPLPDGNIVKFRVQETNRKVFLRCRSRCCWHYTLEEVCMSRLRAEMRGRDG